LDLSDNVLWVGVLDQIIIIIIIIKRRRRRRVFNSAVIMVEVL